MKQKPMKPCTETGSFVNMMMSSNSSMPEVGKGATFLSWTDRHAYEVMSVSDDCKTVIVQQYMPERIDSNGMSDSQDYKYEKLTGVNETIVWRRGAWRKKNANIEYIEDSIDHCFTPEHFDENGLLMLIPNITKEVVKYDKVNVLWGKKDEYYDYTF